MLTGDRNQRVAQIPKLLLQEQCAFIMPHRLAEQAGQRNDVFYITRYSRPKVVMMSAKQVERPVRLVQDGQAALEHERQQAAPSGTAIDDEMEAARGD